MWTVTVYLLCISLLAIKGSILFRRKSTKCEAVVMCPQFCLKVKNGCYICECGDSMNSFMEEAVQKMKHDYDPIYQTGSRYLNVNMGSRGAINGQKPNSAQSPWMSMGMGAFGANSFGGPMMGELSVIEQKGQYLEPDFKEFYRPAGLALPGRCPELNYACPGRCWKTDGFSGCFRCDCEDNKSTAKSTSSSLRMSTRAPLTENKSTTAAPSTKTERTTTHAPATQTSNHATSTVSSHKTSSIVSSSTKLISSQLKNLNNIKINQGKTSELDGTNSSLTSEGNPQMETTGVKGQKGNTSGKSSGNVQQINTVSNSSSTMLTETNLTGRVGPPSAKSLMDLTGVDLFKILIDGIKKHQSLQEVLYTLAHVGGQGHTAQNAGNLEKMDNTEAMKHESQKGDRINNSETSLQQTNSLLTHPRTSIVNITSETTSEPPITEVSGGPHKTDNTEGKADQKSRKDCVDVGAICPVECHVIDPVSHCPVCGCSNKTLKSNDPDIGCAPLDVSCPSDCITLADNMCPVCACTHRQTHKVTSDAVFNTEPTPTTISSQMVCKVTEEIRNCATSCLKFDEHFCPKCTCTANSKSGKGSDNPQNSPENDNICPAVERGCPQRCLKFDKNYCAYCFCDND